MVGNKKNVWSSSCDNSLWGISMDANLSLVCMGDERETRQLRREGLGVLILCNWDNLQLCILDKGLRNVLEKMIILVDTTFDDLSTPITFMDGSVLKERGLFLKGYSHKCNIIYLSFYIQVLESFQMLKILLISSLTPTLHQLRQIQLMQI